MENMYIFSSFYNQHYGSVERDLKRNHLSNYTYPRAFSA